MRKSERLPERQNYFFFEHKTSEVNYGGETKFQQVAFPPPEDKLQDFERLVYHAVDRFGHMLEHRVTEKDQNLKCKQQGLVDVFLDLWGAHSQISFSKFLEWYNTHVIAVARVYRQLRHNALVQEKPSGVKNLNFFVSLSCMTLVSDILSDYFEKHIDRLGRMATTARWTLGRCFSIAFQSAENNQSLRRLCADVIQDSEKERGTWRLFNSFVIGFSDAADSGLIEEIAVGPNPYQVPASFRTKMSKLLINVVEKSKAWETRSVKRSLAEPATLDKLFNDRPTRRTIIKKLRKQNELLIQLVFENCRYRYRSYLRELFQSMEASHELMIIASNDKRLSELFSKKASRKQFYRLLKAHSPKLRNQLKEKLEDEIKVLTKSKHRIFGRLRRREVMNELDQMFKRLAHFWAIVEDFKLLRNHYGKDSNRGKEWLGIKIWRSYDLVFNNQADSDRDRFLFTKQWENRKVDIENNFAEGNMFLIVPEGEIYAKGSGRRRHVIFMFADLRNSTETTMKLTKDTASYLTPYLTTVNTSGKKCHGDRIYFAGDGYAAFYHKIADAIRASYIIHGHFIKLRKESSEETIRKAKEIYQSAANLGVDIKDPSKVKLTLSKLLDMNISEEVKEFMRELAGLNTASVDDNQMKKVLSKVASEYSMPRIDAGIALTSGELFYAMVGEEGEDKIPIVISPQLTQAARLSGSSDLVKKYIDTHFPQPFPYTAYTWDKKLYNRGTVITMTLFHDLQQEVGVFPIATKEEAFSGEKLHYYTDDLLKRNIVIRECQEPVMLKGIAKPCKIYEIAGPGSPLDRKFGNGQH